MTSPVKLRSSCHPLRYAASMDQLGLRASKASCLILKSWHFSTTSIITLNENYSHTSTLIRLIPKILLLIKQIRPATPQIDNLRTPIPILLQPRTLKTVERITDALAATDDAFVLVVAEGAFIAHAHEGGGPDVGVADGTFAVTFVAEAADGDAGRFAAHY